MVVKFGVRGVYPFVHAELVEVGAVGGIERAAAVVFRVGIVIGDAFAAEVVVGALDAAGNFLRAGMVAAVVVGSAFVGVLVIRCGRYCAERGDC